MDAVSSGAGVVYGVVNSHAHKREQRLDNSQIRMEVGHMNHKNLNLICTKNFSTTISADFNLKFAGQKLTLSKISSL